MNYNFFIFTSNTIHKWFKKIFGQSKIATYIFIMSMISGTPTNAYLTVNLEKENLISKKDASIILTYSSFLNPFFLYTIFSLLFNSHITLKLILIYYSVNFIIAFLLRKYPYQEKLLVIKKPLSFSKILSKSLKRSIDTLLLVFGTILFYLLLCEGIAYFITSPWFICIINGILEATGGLSKLTVLNVNFHLKELLALLFISFGGFSIHTQIKNILEEEDISYKPFFFARCFHAFLGIILFYLIP